MQIAIALFEHLTALGAVGPYEVLSRMPGADLHFVGEHRGPVRTDTGRLGLVVDATYDEMPRPDAVAVPGGFGQNDHRDGSALQNWLAYEELAAFGATPTDARVVVDGKYVAAAGVSAGIDMALTLVGRCVDDTTAQAIQIGIEYDPNPPYTTGSHRTAPDHVVEAVSAVRDFIV